MLKKSAEIRRNTQANKRYGTEEFLLFEVSV